MRTSGPAAHLCCPILRMRLGQRVTWWWGPGIGCKGSRVIPTVSANGSPAFGQYKIDPNGGYEPWALQVLELRDGGIGQLTFFLDTANLFPLFGLPLHLDT